jgi:hypothetical protein
MGQRAFPAFRACAVVRAFAGPRPAFPPFVPKRTAPGSFFFFTGSLVAQAVALVKCNMGGYSGVSRATRYFPGRRLAGGS